MKPASVINHGEDFVTLRATTDRPVEIQEALATRDVQHVYKGDQNQGWDAVVSNHCLARAVGENAAEITFFVQDERLGTSDARLARHFRRCGRQYVLTEDYYRGRAGAVWEHQDTSYGLFFTEAVSPEQFARAAVHLHRAAELWEEHAAEASVDAEWLHALGLLGVTLPAWGQDQRAEGRGQGAEDRGPKAAGSADAATRLGPAMEPEALAELAADHPAAGLYYAFTKTDGLYGVVPVENANVTLSSIPAADPELLAAGQWLLVKAAARGAMRMAASAAQRRAVKGRARQLAKWAGEFLAGAPEASVADFQTALGHWLTREIFPADRIELDRTSRFMHLRPADLPALRHPQETLHFFLDLALRHPPEFAAAYNEALNRVGFGLQRVRYDPGTGRYTPPFFVELAPEGPGTPVYRYGLELSGIAATTVTLMNPSAGDLVVESDRRIRSAQDLARTLFEGLECPEGFVIVGKAAAFAAELQRAPRGLGLPRQGSKYAPMVDHLVSGLRARGLLDQPTGLLIRIGLNALDRLAAMEDVVLRPPRFLEGALSPRATCREVSARWRETAAEASALLDTLSRCHFGQHVHLVKAMVLNARGGDWEAALRSDSGLAGLARGLGLEGPVLRSLGKDVPLPAVAAMERLTERRIALLAERDRRFEDRRARALAAGTRKLPPRDSRDEELEGERGRIECQLLLLFGAYVRRLWQRAESLAYVNDRPYTLALYLLFGPAIFSPICREVEFDVEYVSPCSVSAELGSQPREPSSAKQ